MTEDSNGLHQQRVGVGVPTGRRRLEVVFSVSFLSLCNWAADSKSTLHVKRVQNLVIQLRLRRSPRQFGPTEYPQSDATTPGGWSPWIRGRRRRDEQHAWERDVVDSVDGNEQFR